MLKLLEFFRKNNLMVTFATIGDYREDGRDRSPTQARPGWNYTLLKIGSKPQELVDELKPLENEVVVYEIADSALNSSSPGHISRWICVEHIVVAGIFTDQCVSSTVRDLSDWGS
jgi:nicotinamidase-related amidase